MKTEDLIADLAQRVTPVRPLAPPGVRVLRWLPLAAGCGVAGVMLFGARPDVLDRLTQPDYLAIALLALMTSIVGVSTTLVLAVPGAERRPVLRMLTLTLLGGWTVTLLWAVWNGGHGLPVSSDRHWPVCFARVFLMSAIPAFVLFVMVRRGIPLRLGWTAAMAAAGAASVGALAAQLVCPIDDPGHGFLGHFVPVLAMVGVGLSARRLLSPPAQQRGG